MIVDACQRYSLTDVQIRAKAIAAAGESGRGSRRAAAKAAAAPQGAAAQRVAARRRGAGNP